MKDIKNENKKSQLVFEPRVARALLKMNGEWKFCPFCGATLKDGCECHKNFVTDTKPLRGSVDASIFVFDNNAKFREDFDEIMDEIKAKSEAQDVADEEPIEIELG